MDCKRARSAARPALLLVLLFLLAACQPSDQRPGQWLRGTVADGLPDSWAFTDDHGEIFVEVATPYLVPHSVTIWCAQVDGALYIAARNPASKQWVEWMDAEPDVRLKIDERIYSVSAHEVTDADRIARVREAYGAKYALGPAGPDAPPMRYWSIGPRD